MGKPFHTAQRWAGRHNPTRFVLAECIQALTDLSLQLRDAHARIAALEAEAPTA